MSRHAEVPLRLGAPAPEFRLPEPLTGRYVSPQDYPAAAALLIGFVANSCPQVGHIAGALARLARDLAARGLQVLAVNSSEQLLGGDEAPATVAAEALRRGYIFPYVIDQTQAVARAYGAMWTPDFYLFGRDRRLAYHGRFDETRFGEAKRAHGGDLRQAIEAVLKGERPSERQLGARGSPILRWTAADF